MSHTSLPDLVGQSVSAHFNEHSVEIEESLRRRIEDTQLGLLDKFFQKIQSSYAQRIAALEETSRTNDEALREIRGSSERAEQNLYRLMAGIRSLIGDAQPTTEQELAPPPCSKDFSPRV